MRSFGVLPEKIMNAVVATFVELLTSDDIRQWRWCAWLAGMMFIFLVHVDAVEAGAGVNLDYPYAINLESTAKPVEPKSIPYLPEFKKYRLYTTELAKDGKTWHRLRLGFFPTKQEALKVYDRISEAYPFAWATIVSREERDASAKTAIVLKGKPLADIRSDPEVVVPLTGGINRTEALYLPAEVPVIEPSMVTGSAAVPAPEAEPDVKPEVDSGVKPAPVSERPASPASAGVAVPLAAAELSVSESPPNVAPSAVNVAKSDTGRSAQLLEMARKAFTAGEYEKTIQLTTAILELPESPQSQAALELLGLARERNGQLAHARVEYEKYLALYPEGEDAERVNQRLAGLITATSKPTRLASDTKKMTKTKRSSGWQALGSLSQYYYRDERSIDEEDNLVDLSQLVTTFDLTARSRGEEYDQRIQITGDHSADFLNDESEGRFSRFFYEVIDRKDNNNLKLGRQTYSQGGVLGRFDGMLLGVSPDKKTKINAALGYLLDTEGLIDFNYTTNRRFITLNIDIGNELKDWDINFYGMQQMVDDIVDRQAIGGEFRYFKPEFNVFSTIDYDTSYNLLNIFLLNANWVFQQRGNMFLTVDIRRVPYLSTSNALQGQPFTTMSELLEIFTVDEVRQLALDRTALSRTFTVGGSKQLNGFLEGYGQYQISGDFTLNTTTSTPASAGVPSLTGTGNNYFIGGQFIGNGIIKRGDTSILSLRFGSTDTARDIAVSFDTRYPFTRNLRFNPRFQYLRRTGNQNGGVLSTIRLSAKMDYRIKNTLTLEGEIGIDDTKDEVDGFATTSKSLFYYVGYRWDF
jgi:tetratricopeptide (TPR) repeat protein